MGCIFVMTGCASGKVSNGFMSIMMPARLNGTYSVITDAEGISVFDKASHEAGFGGFAFEVCATDDYGAYGGMRTKIGEMTDENGKLYHVLLSFPSDVQWDYTKGEEMPASYKALYESAREIAATVEPDHGGKYIDGAGTKGEEIYGETARKIADTIKSASDANLLEASSLSPIYFAITQETPKRDPMEEIGIVYIDFNLDGVDEMVIGDVKNGDVYDIFASVNGAPAHVTSGYFRDYYKVYGSVLAEYVSEGAGVSVIRTTELLPNSTELFPQYSLKLDETGDAESKWSVSYDDGKTWESMTEEDYRQRLGNIEDLPAEKALTFTPLGKLQ